MPESELILQSLTLEQLKVVQYNILAATYTSSLQIPFSHSQTAHISIVLHTRSSGTIALQESWKRWTFINRMSSYFRFIPFYSKKKEVDLFEVVSQELEQRGFKGVYLQRPAHADGCAIFWKDERFLAMADLIEGSK